LKIDQAKRVKDLEREYTRLKQAVMELTLDKLILKEGRFRKDALGTSLSSRSYQTSLT